MITDLIEFNASFFHLKKSLKLDIKKNFINLKKANTSESSAILKGDRHLCS